MTAATARHAAAGDSDEAQAVIRMIMGLTLSTGGMVAASGAATDSPHVLAALPTVLMAGFILLGATPAAGWCGVAIWVVLMPMAHAEGILAALSMMAVCGIVAIGPERVSAWIADARPAEAAPNDGDMAWIEEL